MTEKEARQGKIELFKIGGGKSIKVKIKTINQNEDWLDDAAKVDDLYTQVGSATSSVERRKSEREFTSALYDCVFSYDEELDRETLELQVTPQQMTDAFERLKEDLNPFALHSKKEQEKQFAVFEKLPPDVMRDMMRLIDEDKLKL